MSLAETIKFVKGLAPAADRYNGDPATDIINLANYDKVCFLIHQQGGTTGKATVTVEACDDLSASATQAIAFRYAVGASGAASGGDLMGNLQEALAAGFDTTPATDRQYLIEVKADELPSGYPYVRLQLTEAANDPVNACVEVLCYGARYKGEALPTAIE